MSQFKILSSGIYETSNETHWQLWYRVCRSENAMWHCAASTGYQFVSVSNMGMVEEIVNYLEVLPCPS